MWVRTGSEDPSRPEIVAAAPRRMDRATLVGLLTILRCYSAQHLTDGFLPATVVTEAMTDRWIRILVDADLLHEAGTTCSCHKGMDWPPWAAYSVHDYLETNPTRDETDVRKTKRAELDDGWLRHQTHARDSVDGHTFCRYCGTEVILGAQSRVARAAELDHVDPARADGLENLVTACRQCNRRKGDRRPEAVGMAVIALEDLGRKCAPASRVRPKVSSPDALRDGTGTESVPVRTSAAPNPVMRPDDPGRPRPEHYAGLPERLEPP